MNSPAWCHQPALACGLLLLLMGVPALAPAQSAATLSKADARAQAKRLADSQQQVVQLSNQLQGLEAKASQSQQVLAGQDQQIARLKAALDSQAATSAKPGGD